MNFYYGTLPLVHDRIGYNNPNYHKTLKIMCKVVDYDCVQRKKCVAKESFKSVFKKNHMSQQTISIYDVMVTQSM